MLPDSKEIELYSCGQIAVPTTISGIVYTSEVPDVICYDRWILSYGQKK